MEKRGFYQLSILVTTAIITLGCVGNKTATPIPKPTVAVNKPSVAVPVVPQAPSGISLANLKSAGVSKLSLRGSRSYSQNEPIQFIIDTKDAEGFLYIIYADNKGGTGLLYPNEKSPLSEVSGKYIFPRDFGNMNIRATKDCVGCEEERTTVYALLSKEPIVDIKNITKTQLLSFTGSSVQSKGLSMNLDAGNADSDANVNVGVIEFSVK
ncbi:MAG: DUF4384 domain-containing protein [Epsilonproteobacteria bacterium]|nr:DUF4384 domain-containing protein [Campylobacterota bacterium]